MPKNVKSQWDFGELFDPATTRRVLTVSELTATVRRLLEKEVGQIWVSGEVTNLRAQSSGHLYFTLKDAGAQLSCVLFRNEAVAHREYLQDGQSVLLQGLLTVYEVRGQYQLRVTAVELRGLGALQLAFEKLKQKLQTEGLFASERKRPLARYPQRIGLITSPTGAAIRDVLHVIERRQPALEIILASCRVQGMGAAEEIASAIRLLNEWAAWGPERRLDLILITRGGGSLEDLWAFNEEVVARAIFHSAIPVVSAVGHEIDFTIADFVADLRAATPSAAAELITEGAFASREFIAETVPYLRRLVRQRLEQEEQGLQQLTQRLSRVHPRSWLNERMQYLDDLQASLSRCVKQGFRTHRLAWQTLAQRFLRAKPSLAISQRRQLLLELERRLREQTYSLFQRLQYSFTNLQARLGLLSPDNTLARGYSITMDATTGRIIRAASDVRAGAKMKTQLQQGDIRSVVED